jgi:hypothetical protein
MSGSDSEAVMAGYLVALEGVTADALKRTAMAIIKGEIADLSARACPTAPELSREVRKRMAAERRLELAGATARYEPYPFTALAIRMDATRRRMEAEGRTFLFGVNGHAEARARAKECPAGSLYVGLLGAFYGPPSNQGEGNHHEHDRYQGPHPGRDAADPEPLP